MTTTRLTQLVGCGSSWRATRYASSPLEIVAERLRLLLVLVTVDARFSQFEPSAGLFLGSPSLWCTVKSCRLRCVNSRLHLAQINPWIRSERSR